MKKTRLLSSHSQHPHQSGFTLVEIMVALTIGLMMMAGILQVSLANKESSRLQRNMGFVQENIRTAMELLSRDLRMAGHYTDNNSADRILTSLSPFDITSTVDGGGMENDTITISYESDRDCLDQATFDELDPNADSYNHYAVNRYYISNQRLMCLGNGNATAQPLVEGVESLQILYGENTNGDPRSANRYVQPQQLDDVRNVVSVRIGMRFISREQVRTATDNNQYALLDAVAFAPLAGDRHLRREITTTISLRNER